MKYILFISLGLGIPVQGMLIPYDFDPTPIETPTTSVPVISRVQSQQSEGSVDFQLTDKPLTLVGQALRKISKEDPRFNQLPEELKKPALIVDALQSQLRKQRIRSLKDAAYLLNLPEVELDTADVATATKVIEAFGNPTLFYLKGIQQPSLRTYATAAFNFKDRFDQKECLFDKNMLGEKLYSIASGKDTKLAEALLRAGASPYYSKIICYQGWRQDPVYSDCFDGASAPMKALFESFLKNEAKS